MYIQIVVAMVTYQIVLITLVITQEDILAMHTPIVLPPSLSLLNGLTLGVIIVGERYIMLTQVRQYCFFSCHNLVFLYQGAPCPLYCVTPFY